MGNTTFLKNGPKLPKKHTYHHGEAIYTHRNRQADGLQSALAFRLAIEHKHINIKHFVAEREGQKLVQTMVRT